MQLDLKLLLQRSVASNSISVSNCGALILRVQFESPF